MFDRSNKTQWVELLRRELGDELPFLQYVPAGPAAEGGDRLEGGTGLAEAGEQTLAVVEDQVEVDLDVWNGEVLHGFLDRIAGFGLYPVYLYGETIRLVLEHVELTTNPSEG